MNQISHSELLSYCYVIIIWKGVLDENKRPPAALSKMNFKFLLYFWMMMQWS